MRKLALIMLVLWGTALLASAQSADSSLSPWTLRVAPTFALPLTGGDFSSNTVFSTSFGARLGAEYALKAPVSLRLGAAYSSTSFGIIFVSVFKIFHLRPTRRRLVMETETEAVQPAAPAKAA